MSHIEEEIKKGDGQKIPEIVLASEAVQISNYRSIVEYVKQSRSIIKAQNEEINGLHNHVTALTNQVDQLRKQFSIWVAPQIAGGTAPTQE